MSNKINPYIVAVTIGKRLEDFQLDGQLPEMKMKELIEYKLVLDKLYQQAIDAGVAPKKFEDLDNKVWD